MFKMTSVILGNLFSPKATRLYPRTERKPFAGVRGELYNVIEECTFCTACAVKCPSHCLEVDRKKATWEYDPFACVFCGICAEICPPKSLHLKEKYRAPVKAKGRVFMQGTVKKKASESSSPTG
jgi:ech hydrogenase subunit F